MFVYILFLCEVGAGHIVGEYIALAFALPPGNSKDKRAVVCLFIFKSPYERQMSCMHKFFANIISAFVRDKRKRHKLRDRLTTKSKFKQLQDEVYALNCLIKAQALHKDTFGPFRGILTGKEVVIVATGPTLNDYVPIEGAIHIGVNAAFKWQKARLDYLFLQDAGFAGEDRRNRAYGYGVTDINQYKGDGCVKFYGMVQRMIFDTAPTVRIPLVDLLASGAKPYIVEYLGRHSIAYDLSYEPMGSYSSVVFSAMQFALFTNAKRIYLVGTDCGGGHFYKNGKKDMSIDDTTNLIEDWKTFHDHIETWYPETEVVSINPRRLAGLFKDIHTVPPSRENA